MGTPTVSLNERPGRRSNPLALVATTDEALNLQLVELMQGLGYAACRARTSAGCLRVATATGPDVVLLDDRWPRSVERLLSAHPATAASQVVRVSVALKDDASVPGSHLRVRAPGQVALSAT